MSRKKTLLQRSCLNVEKKRSAVTDQETTRDRKETTSSNETKLDLEYEEKRKSLNRGIYFRPISIDCGIYCLVSCITRRGNDETRQDETKEREADSAKGVEIETKTTPRLRVKRFSSSNVPRDLDFRVQSLDWDKNDSGNVCELLAREYALLKVPKIRDT